MLIGLGYTGGHLLKGSALGFLWRLDEALVEHELALKDESVLAEFAAGIIHDARHKLVFLYLWNERWKDALREITPLLGNVKTRGRAYSQRASVWHSLWQWRKCIADCDKALACGYDKNYAVTALRLSALHALGETGEYDEREYLIGLEILEDPSYKAQILQSGALGKMENGDPEGALEMVGSLIRPSSKGSSYYRLRGRFWRMLGEDEKALADLDNGLEVGKAQTDWVKVLKAGKVKSFGHVNRAVALERLGRKEEAAQGWARAIELAPRSDLPHFYRGLVFAHFQDYARAVPHWKRGVELYESNLGRFPGDKLGVEQLRSACDAAKNALWNNSDMYLVSGWLYLQNQDYARAGVELGRALAIDSGNTLAKVLMDQARSMGEMPLN